MKTVNLKKDFYKEQLNKGPYDLINDEEVFQFLSLIQKEKLFQLIKTALSPTGVYKISCANQRIFEIFMSQKGMHYNEFMSCLIEAWPEIHFSSKNFDQKASDMMQELDPIFVAEVSSTIKDTRPRVLILSNLFSELSFLLKKIDALDFHAEGVSLGEFQSIFYHQQFRMHHIRGIAQLPAICKLVKPESILLTKSFNAEITQYTKKHGIKVVNSIQALKSNQRFRCKIPTDSKKIGVVWEGRFFEPTSFAHVDDELILKLDPKKITLSLLPQWGRPKTSQIENRLKPIVPFLDQLLSKIDFHIRVQFPPNWEIPYEGQLILIKPWEYGTMPIDWLKGLQNVREIWATTNFVRDTYIWSGIPGNRVHVIPHGVDPKIFSPIGPALTLRTKKTFRFLYIGGMIHRKGYDILIKAFVEEFSPHEDVCLVLQDIFYSGGDRQGVQAIAERNDVPEIFFFNQPLSPAQIPQLYRACHAYVQPYRGEGFCLPVLEAMACGLPTVTTGFGAVLDFCHPGNSYLLPATFQFAKKKVVDADETIDYPFWPEADLSTLRKTLREIFTNYQKARHLGLLAAQEVLPDWTWDRPARMIEERLQVLKKTPEEKFVLQTKTSTKSLVKHYNLYPPNLNKLKEEKPSWKALQAHQLLRRYPKKAELAFLELAQIPNWKGEALYGLAQLTQQMGNTQKAIKLLEQALKTCPFHTLAKENLILLTKY